jgi:aerobic-type carbon monoxide dehydrogenase small subunit (CoxS/CutS family)
MEATVSDPVHVSLTVNGCLVDADVEPRVHLADFLRHDVGLTGTHVGCEQGACGNCTVIVDGVAVKSCLTLAVQADGCEIATVESLAKGDQLSALQQAFKDAHALQCGYCTPGFLMTITALERRDGALSREELRGELAGVICRCTGYETIIDAAEDHLTEVSARG